MEQKKPKINLSSTVLAIAAILVVGFFLFTAATAHAYSLHAALLSPGTTDWLAPSIWLFTHTDATTGGTVVGVWNVALGLANAFVALVLLFFAIVNISHIQYDTYQLKKSLPYLILGIVLANFSMLIVRMIVDVAQVMANTFIYDGPNGSLASDLLKAFPTDISGNLLFFLIVFLVAIIAVAIIAFLLWVRLFVILLIAGAAPLAFVMMAFTPTQGIFKKWLDWLLRWAFMAPIMMAVLWVAAQIAKSNNNDFNIAVIFAVSGLMYVAAIIPFQLGGAVMGAWGGLGKGIAKGAGNAVWNNPWSKAIRAEGGRKMSNYLRSNRSPIGSIMRSYDKARAGEALATSRAKAEDEARLATGEQIIRRRAAERAAEGKGESIEASEEKVKEAKRFLETGTATRTSDFYHTEEGKIIIGHELNNAMAKGDLEKTKTDGTFEIYEGARKDELAKYEAGIKNSTDRLEKIKDDGRVGYGADRLRGLYELGQTEDLRAAGEERLAAEEALAALPQNATPEELAAAQQQFNDADENFKTHEGRLKTFRQVLDAVDESEAKMKRARTPEERQQVQTELDAKLTKINQDTITEDNPNGYQVSRQQAEQILNQQAQRLVAEGQINTLTGKVFEIEEAKDFLKSSNLDNYAEKRYYAIVSKRAAEDASTDAQSYSPTQVKESFLNPDGTFRENSYGIWKMTKEDGAKFFKGEALSSAHAGHVASTEMSQLKLQMRGKTYGAALKTACEIINVGNAELLGAAVQNAWDGVKDEDKKKILKFAIEAKVVRPGTTDLSTDKLRELISDHQLNTSDKTFSGFANAIANQLEEGDGRSLTYDKSDGAGRREEKKSVIGRTGLGRSAWSHDKKSGNITYERRGPTRTSPGTTPGAAAPQPTDAELAEQLAEGIANIDTIPSAAPGGTPQAPSAPVPAPQAPAGASFNPEAGDEPTVAPAVTPQPQQPAPASPAPTSAPQPQTTVAENTSTPTTPDENGEEEAIVTEEDENE